MVLVWLSCAWLIGLVLGAEFGFSPLLLPGLLAFLPALWFFPKRRTLAFSGLCLLVLLGGMGWWHLSHLTDGPGLLHSLNDQGTVEILGTVNRDPDPGKTTSHLYVSLDKVLIGEEWSDAAGCVLVYTTPYPDYHYGDVLRIHGTPETPPEFDDFDYAAFLADRDIFTVMNYPAIEKTGEGEGFILLRGIHGFRNSLSGSIDRLLPEPQASLVNGILLGKRESIPQDVKSGFAVTGTAHLLAISGLHLSIVAGIVLSLGVRLFGRRGNVHIWLTLAIVWLYALLTGFNPPVLRAAVMVSLYLSAELLGRQKSAFTALAFAAAVMAGFNPNLLFDASFQMSFGAMAGVIFVYPLLQVPARKAAGFIAGDWGIPALILNTGMESLAVSLAAIAGVWPLIAWYFGTVSPVGPLATLLVLPVLPVLILSGFVTALLGLVLPGAGQAAGWLTWLFASYMLRVVDLFSAIPAIEINWGNALFVWIYYAAGAAFLFFLHSRKKREEDQQPSGAAISRFGKFAVLPLILASVLVWTAALSMPDDNLRVTFLDVGQGDAALIQQGSLQIIVDGGPAPSGAVNEIGNQMPFWDRSIDLVVLTHPHADHLTGLVELLKRYRVGRVLLPESGYESDILDEWNTLIEEQGTEITFARAGQHIDLGGVSIIEVLHPQDELLSGTKSDIDNNSIVFRLEHGEVSFLFTADIMAEAERELIHYRAGIRCTVLKVAHHGSATSSTPGFLAVAGPAVAVIPSGGDNLYEHPGNEVIERLRDSVGEENIFPLALTGTVTFTTDGERLWVELH